MTPFIVPTLNSALYPTMLLSNDLVISYLITGFSFGIIIYHIFLYNYTRQSIYLHFSGALLGFVIGIGEGIGLWHLNFLPQNRAAPLLDAFNLILFSTFILHFLNLCVNFKNVHPFIYRTSVFFCTLASLLILGIVVLPYQNLVVAIHVLIVLSCLTPLVSIYYWYKTIKHLQVFIITMVFFLLAMGYYHIHALIFNTHSSSTYSHLGFFSGALLFLSFSTLITNQLKEDRKQRKIAQAAAIQNLEKYQSLYHNSLEGLFTVRSDGRLLSSNPALKRLLNLPADLHFIGQQIHLLHSYFAQPQTTWNMIMRVLANHEYVESLELQGKNSTWYTLSARRITDKHNTLIEGSLADITQHKLQEQKLSYLASHDPLTNLFNRSTFETHLQAAIDSKSVHILLFVDLDHFKVINDTCGHAAGDECLRQVAKIFNQYVTPKDTLARLGGDEFVIILWEYNFRAGLHKANLIRQALENNYFKHQERAFKTPASFGLIALGHNILTVEQAMIMVDAACYEAKDGGRNRVAVSNLEKQPTIYRHSQMDMVTTLTQALVSQQLVLFQQPITGIQATPLNLRHYEILLRLRTHKGLLAPNAFLPAAQRHHMLPQIDRWVFNRTCQWLTENDNLAQTGRVYINMSPQTLSKSSFIGFIHTTLKTYAVPPEKICFEITEYNALNNFTQALQTIYTLRGLGFSFALDDFGSGFASFDHAKRLPVDIIKIDGQFIRNINQDANNKTMVQAVTNIAHNMGKKIIAEWIEDAATLATLNQMGVDFGQGFYCGKPEALYDYQEIICPET